MFSLPLAWRTARLATLLLLATAIMATTMLPSLATAQMESPTTSPSPSPSSHAHSHAGHGASSSSADSSSSPVAVPDEPCFADPSSPDCANYIRPKGSWLPELTRLCDAMDWMPGCTLWRECQASNSLEGYCYHPSLVGNICLDMPKMKGCEPWNALCGGGGSGGGKNKSVVPQCIKPGPLAGLPTTDQATRSVQSMCSSHSMPGCDGCKQGAAAGGEGCRDPLLSLAAVCSSMPGMRDCRQLAEACGAKGASELFPKTCELVSSQKGTKSKKKGGDAAASLASTSGDASSAAAAGFDLPPMRMWLHANAEDIVLAKQWVPRSPATVAAACLGSVGGGFLSQALRAARGAAEAAVASNLRRSLSARGGLSDGGRRRLGLFSSPSAGARLGRNSLRAVSTFASSLLDLLLMLIAMTFSWPLILSVAGGYGLGALAFGGMGEPRPAGGGKGADPADEGSSGAAENGFSNVEGIHLHGGSEGVDGASCCDTGGGIGRGKLSRGVAAAAAENSFGGGGGKG